MKAKSKKSIYEKAFELVLEEFVTTNFTCDGDMECPDAICGDSACVKAIKAYYLKLAKEMK